MSPFIRYFTYKQYRKILSAESLPHLTLLLVRLVKYWFSFSALVKPNQYLTNPYQYIIAFFCLHVFWLVFIMKVFIIKVTVKENSFAWSLQRDELLQCWKFREFLLNPIQHILITSAKKRNKVSINITSSNFILRVHCKDLFYALPLSLFLIYNESCSTLLNSLQPIIYYFSLLYAKTLAAKLSPDLKANLNGHPSICHSIQIWIRIKKVYFHGKRKKNFTDKSASTFTICRNFI